MCKLSPKSQKNFPAKLGHIYFWHCISSASMATAPENRVIMLSSNAVEERQGNAVAEESKWI